MSTPNDPTRTSPPADPSATRDFHDRRPDGDAANDITASQAGPSADALTPYVSIGGHQEGSRHLGRSVVDRYLLAEEIARGGMGVVCRARDTVLDREVAVKLLKPEYDIHSLASRRFEEEARITGQLQHPAIPPIHDLGVLLDGRPFLAMKLIKGETLDALLRKRSSPADDRGRFIAVFEQICQALAYAHARGVIHRDLKPANVMVGAFGEVQVMDWGLAKVFSRCESPIASNDREVIVSEVESGASIIAARASEDQLTRDGAIFGTPSYMPPEQAVGEVEKIDRRSDVFGLGGILAAILTGKPPFVGESVATTHLMAAAGEIHPCFERLDSSGVDPDLVALAKRCLSPERDRRPEDAGSVAAEVAALRLAAEERARQAEVAVAQAAEQRRRRRVQWALACAMLLFVMASGFGVTVASLWQSAETQRSIADGAKDDAIAQKQQADAAKDDALKARQEAEQARAAEFAAREKLAAVEYGRTMQVAYQEWVDNHSSATRMLLDAADTRFRGWEWRYLDRICDNSSSTPIRNVNAHKMALSNDKSKLAFACMDRTVKIFQVGTYKLLNTLIGHTDEVWDVSWSPDGSRLATTSWDSSMKIWDVNSGFKICSIKNSDKIAPISWSPDGSRIAVGGWNKQVKIWDINKESFIMSLVSDGAPSSISWRNNYTLAVGYINENLIIWDTINGKAVATLRGHDGPILSVSWSPNGMHIASGSSDRTAKVWEAEKGVCICTLSGHRSGLSSVSWSPDGLELATASEDTTIRIWDLRKCVERLVFKGHQNRVRSVIWGISGSYLVSTDQNGKVKLWDPKEVPFCVNIKCSHYAVGSIAWSVDGKKFAACTLDGLVRIFDAFTFRELAVLKHPFRHITSIAWDPAGSRVATSGSDGIVKIWDVSRGIVVSEYAGHSQKISSIAWDATGSRIATGSWDKSILIWNTTSNAEEFRMSGLQDEIWAIAWNADGSRLVSGGRGASVQVWDILTRKEITRLNGHKSIVSSLAWSHDGSRVACASWDYTVRIWDVDSHMLTTTLSGHTSVVTSVSWESSGKRIVSGGYDSVKIWDTISGAEVLSFNIGSQSAHSVCWSPDEECIVVGNDDGTISIHNSIRYRERRHVDPKKP